MNDNRFSKKNRIRISKKIITTSICIALFSLLPGTTALADPENGVTDGTVTVTNTESNTESNTELNSEGSTLSPSDSIYYTGPIDLVTGQPETEESQDSSGQLVNVGNGVTYDRFSRRYIYSVGNSRILSSVADGMVVSESVVLSKDGEMNLAVYKDGESMSEIPSEITSPGSYVVATWTDNAQNQILSFQIVNSVTGRLNHYILPQGFNVQSVVLDGERIAHGNGSVNFDKEGEYIVNYICNANSVEYTLKVRIDHTPPQITFGGLDADNEARGPVTIQGVEKDDAVYITFNDDTQVTMDDDNQVSETGYYHVVVVDPAGNYIEKDFRILLYLNFNATLFIVAVLLVIIGVCTALLIARKKLRIR